MITCPQCGIQREPGFSECPLCKGSYNDLPNKQPEPQMTYPGIEKPLTRKEKNHLFWELAGILHFSSMVVLFIIDLVLNKKPGWSWYAIAGIAASFIYITLMVFTGRKPLFLLTGLLFNTCGLLFTIDWLNGSLNWFLMPALPLAAIFFLFTGLVLLFIRKTRNKGLNIIAAIAVAIGVFVIITDLCISWIKHQNLVPTWSLVVAAAILPFALFLFYFHYRLKRGTSLRKFFHL